MLRIVNDRGHLLAYCGNKFLVSADNEREMQKELAELGYTMT